MQPTNGQLIIEPLAHDTFIATDRNVYEEIGVVLALPDDLVVPALVGDRVCFDSWLASKYPKNDKEFYWFVSWKHVKGYEHVRGQVPE